MLYKDYVEKIKNLKKRHIIIGIVIITVLTISITCITQSKQVKYKTKPIERCTITEVVEASGTINPVNTVSVGSTVSGLIKEIYVDYNDVVKKGQILAQIDPANFEATVQQNQAQINNARANLAKLQAIANYDQNNTLDTKIFMQKIS